MGVIHDEWWGISFFIQVFQRELVDTDQVGLMTKLSDIKTEWLPFIWYNVYF